VRQTEQRGIIGAAHVPHARLLQRALVWTILGVCGALLVAVSGEALARANVQAQVVAAQAQVAALRTTIAQTSHAIVTATSNDEIERAARRWGYVRPGDQPIVLVGSATH
jgi:cell division protein FtsB